jgi:hypothetical protein
MDASGHAGHFTWQLDLDLRIGSPESFVTTIDAPEPQSPQTPETGTDGARETPAP